MPPGTARKRKSTSGMTSTRWSAIGCSSRPRALSINPSCWRWTPRPPMWRRPCVPASKEPRLLRLRISSNGSTRTSLRISPASGMRSSDCFGRARMAEVTMAQALNEALRFSLNDDDRVLILGEDIGKLGGVFRITDKLQAEFGEQRVFDTPLAESAIAGVSLGLTQAGWRPVAEMQFEAFSYPALDQVISHIAKYRFRSTGAVDPSLVIRIPCGGGIGAAEHHSESPETYYAHTSGLKVVIPSTALDAFNLLVRSIRDPDPVIFFEPKSRYWSKESGDLSPDGLPFGVARTVREGSHATLVTWGGMVARCLQAAGAAADDGVELEVIDLRTLVPLDLQALAGAARKTGRVVVVHEAPMTAGFGAEVVARVVEEAFEYLEAPVLRVTGYDTPYPPAKSEEYYLPDLDRILGAVQRTLTF